MTWTKDNSPLLASTRFNTKYEPTSGDVDIDVNFVKKIDTGNYICKAVNPYGTDETVTRINILDVPNIDETPLVDPEKFIALESEKPINNNKDNSSQLVPPRVLIPLSDARINEGEPILFSCRIDGFPKPKVKGKIVFQTLIKVQKISEHFLINNLYS